MEDKSILVYDITSKPFEDMTISEFMECTLATGFCFWDSSLGGKAPYIIKGDTDEYGIERLKIKDLADG